MKYSESEAYLDFESKPAGGNHIIDVEHSSTIATTKVHPRELEEPKEGERLFHLHM
jgi:hypothetical protein